MASVSLPLPSQALSQIEGIPFGAEKSDTVFELAAAIRALHLGFRPAVFVLIQGTLPPRSNLRQSKDQQRYLFSICLNLFENPNISEMFL
jgi:hypothetical protein